MSEELEIKALKTKILKYKLIILKDNGECIIRKYYSLCKRILEFEYQRRDLSLPPDDTLIREPDEYEGGIKTLNYRGDFKCLFRADFKNFYPSIIKEFDMQPSWDKYNIYKLLVDRLINISNQDLNPDETSKIKHFMAYFCYGFIGYMQSPFCDRYFASKVAEKGRLILLKTLEQVKKIQPKSRIIMADTDGFVANLSGGNFGMSYVQEAKRIVEELNNFLNFNYIKLKFKGFYTEGIFNNISDYNLYNQYTKEYVRKPFTQPEFY